MGSKYQERILLGNSGTKKLNILMSSSIHFKEYNFRRFRDENNFCQLSLVIYIDMIGFDCDFLN